LAGAESAKNLKKGTDCSSLQNKNGTNEIEERKSQEESHKTKGSLNLFLWISIKK